ncbi:MAG TPA: asparaginase [Clostridia bacterium]|nr:asparaginase [Clostridia bacterium]
MKKLLLIATGGTIACSEGTKGLAPSMSASDILSYASDSIDGCSIDAFQLFNIDSTNMQPEYWLDIMKMIKDRYEEYDGFIVTHGTDTMAYTSAALFYLIQNSVKPIVITGAQKPISYEKTDARKNLTDAICFAREGIGGVYLVFDGKVISGSRAEKLRTESYNAFESINYPFIAKIIENKVVYNKKAQIQKKSQKTLFSNSLNSNVFLMKLVPGSNPHLLNKIANDYDGFIIESYGSGGIPFEGNRNFLEAIESLTSMGKSVVITTQVTLEGSNLTIYEVGKRALESAVIPAYDMPIEAVVTKLMWTLGQSRNQEKIRQLFLTPIENDIVVLGSE